jgi:hypothetical protein
MACRAISKFFRTAAMASGAACSVLAMGLGVAIAAAFGGYVLRVKSVAVEASGSLCSIVGRKKPLLSDFDA